MTIRFYGNLDNRLMENKHIDKDIEVGMRMTEFGYSDREAYEVIAVADQKHVTVRRLDHKHVGSGSMDNHWELVSNENNPSQEMTKRGNYWYWTVTITADLLDRLDDINVKLFLWHNDVDIEKLAAKGKVTKYHRANVSFGHADYYYDYEF